MTVITNLGEQSSFISPHHPIHSRAGARVPSVLLIVQLLDKARARAGWSWKDVADAFDAAAAAQPPIVGKPKPRRSRRPRPPVRNGRELPAGRHRVMITSSIVTPIRPTAAAGVLNLVLTAVDGPHRGASLVHRLTIEGGIPWRADAIRRFGAAIGVVCNSSPLSAQRFEGVTCWVEVMEDVADGFNLGSTVTTHGEFSLLLGQQLIRTACMSLMSVKDDLSAPSVHRSAFRTLHLPTVSPVMRIARKSLTFVSVGPVTIESPSAPKNPCPSLLSRLSLGRMPLAQAPCSESGAR
jgi:hypothetical protein